MRERPVDHPRDSPPNAPSHARNTNISCRLWKAIIITLRRCGHAETWKGTCRVLYKGHCGIWFWGDGDENMGEREEKGEKKIDERKRGKRSKPLSPSQMVMMRLRERGQDQGPSIDSLIHIETEQKHLHLANILFSLFSKSK